MSPRWPSLATSSRRMTSMVGPPYPLGAVPGGEGQQGDVARPLDGHLQLPLVRGADARDPPRQNLAPVAHELPDRHVLVVNMVDLLHAELADAAAVGPPAGAGRWRRAARCSRLWRCFSARLRSRSTRTLRSFRTGSATFSRRSSSRRASPPPSISKRTKKPSRWPWTR